MVLRAAVVVAGAQTALAVKAVAKVAPVMARPAATRRVTVLAAARAQEGAVAATVLAMGARMPAVERSQARPAQMSPARAAAM